MWDMCFLSSGETRGSGQRKKTRKKRKGKMRESWLSCEWSIYLVSKPALCVCMCVCARDIYPDSNPGRGSLKVVVRELWSTKYLTPSAVYFISQPGGSGGSWIILNTHTYTLLCVKVWNDFHSFYRWTLTSCSNHWCCFHKKKKNRIKCRGGTYSQNGRGMLQKGAGIQ